MELIDVIRKIAALGGITVEHEIARQNVRIGEQHHESGEPLPCANVEARETRRKGARKRGVEKARKKRRRRG